MKIFKLKTTLALALLTACVLVGWLTWRQVTQVKSVIRIGVLHSLTGTMALSEQPLVDAIRLAAEEINASGGLLGRSLEIVVADGKSDPAIAALEAERLITSEKVSVLFGCWTSACRKAVKPVVERHQHLLFYALQYEGMEQSPNIIYTGATPNQQIVPGTRWAMQQFGGRVYLVGSDYVFPRTANLIVRDLLRTGNGQVVGERYVPLGATQMDAVIKDIGRTQPDVVLNTINGDSNAALFSALEKAGLTNLPMLSFSVDENGMQAWAGARLTRHYGVWSYFQSLPTDDNRHFVQAFRARFGAERLTSDPIEASYTGLHLWAQAVVNSGFTDPNLVNSTVLRQSRRSPSGITAIDAESRHTWKNLRIGQVRADGQFEQVFGSAHLIDPDPWPSYRSRAHWQTLMEGKEP